MLQWLSHRDGTANFPVVAGCASLIVGSFICLIRALFMHDAFDAYGYFLGSAALVTAIGGLSVARERLVTHGPPDTPGKV